MKPTIINGYNKKAPSADQNQRGTMLFSNKGDYEMATTENGVSNDQNSYTNYTQGIQFSQGFPLSDWKIPVSIHEPPINGWQNTNSLTKAKVNGGFPIVQLLDKCKEVDDTSIKETKKADGTVKKEEIGKLHLHLWTPCTWLTTQGNRSIKKVEAVHAMVFDFDEVTTEQKDSILERAKPFAYHAHSTFSEGSDLKKGHAFRMVIPLSHPIPAHQYPHVWQHLTTNLFPENDISTKDPSRFWYLHGVRGDRKGQEWIVKNEGTCIDTNAVLEMEPTQPPLNDAGGPSTPPPPTKKSEDEAAWEKSTASKTTDNSLQDADPIVKTSAGKKTKKRVEYVDWEIVPPIKIEKGGKGQAFTLEQIIRNWDKITEAYGLNGSGNLDVISPFRGRGITRGGAYIQRITNLQNHYPRFVLNCNASNTMYRVIQSYGGVRLGKDTGRPVVDHRNLKLHMIHSGNHTDLWLDKRKCEPMRGDDILSEQDAITIGMEACEKMNPLGRMIGKGAAFDTVMDVCMLTQRDLLVEKLDSLPEWNGSPQIETFFIDHLDVEDTPINRIYSKKWFIGAVARAYDWGVQFDSALILKGVQGLRKSTLWRILAMGHVLDSPIDIKDKDGRAKLKQGWIVEFPELNNLNGGDVERIKAFLTQMKDTFRPVYLRKDETFLRRNVFVGTTNNEAFLKDSTGNRRFWCMKSQTPEYEEAFHPKAIHAIVEMLWAEAKFYYEQGIINAESHLSHEKYEDHLFWLSSEEKKMSASANQDYEEYCPHKEIIGEWLMSKNFTIPTLVSVAQVIEEAYTQPDGDYRKKKVLSPPKWNQKIPNILLTYGCKKVGRKILNGKKQTCYEVPVYQHKPKRKTDKEEWTADIEESSAIDISDFKRRFRP